MPGPTVKSGWEKVSAVAGCAGPPRNAFDCPRVYSPWGFCLGSRSAWAYKILWRAPARAGRRLFRIDLVLVPLALILFLLGWELLVRWQGYASFILPGPGLVWGAFLALARDGTLAMHTVDYRG